MVKANSSCEKHTVVTIMFSITNGASRVCCAGQQGLEGASHHHCSGLCLRGRAQATAQPQQHSAPRFFWGESKRFLPKLWVSKAVAPLCPHHPTGWVSSSISPCNHNSTHIEPYNNRKGWVWRNLKNHLVTTYAQGCHPLDQVTQDPLQSVHHPLLKRKILWAVGAVLIHKIASKKFLISASSPKHPNTEALAPPLCTNTPNNKNR